MKQLGDVWRSCTKDNVEAGEIGNVEELETLATGTKAKDITPSIAWSRGMENRIKRKNRTIFLEKTRKVHHHSDRQPDS